MTKNIDETIESTVVLISMCSSSKRRKESTFQHTIIYQTSSRPPPLRLNILLDRPKQKRPNLCAKDLVGKLHTRTTKVIRAARIAIGWRFFVQRPGQRRVWK